ncbi:hypothetical protein D3C76_1470340 [compost metagenome]
MICHRVGGRSWSLVTETFAAHSKLKLSFSAFSRSGSAIGFGGSAGGHSPGASLLATERRVPRRTKPSRREISSPASGMRMARQMRMPGPSQ